MAQTTQAVHAVGAKRVKVAGSFYPNGTSAVATTKGKGFSVARSDVGKFTITFDRAYPELVSFIPGLRLGTLADTTIIGGDYSATAGTLVVQVYVEGTGAADIAADADSVISFEATFRDSVMDI